MEDRTVQFLRTHACSEGLTDDAVRDIAGHAERVRYESGEVIHSAHDVMSSVYLIVGGQTKHVAWNMQGKPILERIYSRGDQFGGFGAALAEPVPVRVTSHGPSVLLRFDYQMLLKLTLKHEKFRENMSRLIARGIQKLISGDKKRKRALYVAMYHESDATREITTRLARRLQALGENPCILSDQPDPPPLEGVRRRALIEGGDYIGDGETRRQIVAWSDSERIFFDLKAGNGRINPCDVFLACEHVFICIEPHTWESIYKRLRSMEGFISTWREKISIIWLLGDQHPLAPSAPELKAFAQEDFKLSFAAPKPRRNSVLAHGLERLVHLLRGVRIGVALGGGAARGMAHLGVLKALEQHGIVVDMIAGTSAGAMTGTVLSYGVDHDYSIRRFTEDLAPPRLFRLLPKGDQWFLLYKYRRGHFDPMLRRYLKDVRLEQLHLPMHTITVDLVSGQPVVRAQGDAVHAILESINLPVLAAPICRGGEALVDGGLINNVPANVLVGQGCNVVIAVSVTAKLESRFGKNEPSTPTEGMKPPSVLETILRSYVVQNMNMNSFGVQPADVVIEPDVTDFDLTSFGRTNELAAIGEQATLDALPGIKELLGKLDKELFPCDHSTCEPALKN